MSNPEGSPQADGTRFAARLNAEEFCAQFQASFRVHWLIAVGIVREASLAEDVVQEAALIALGKLNEFTPGTNFNAWLGRVVRFVALNCARKEHKRRTPGGDRLHEAEEVSDPSRIDTGAAGIWRRGLDDQIEKALHSVSDMARACLLLRTVEGLSYADIAALLDIPEGTAMSHVHRSRHFLRARLANLAPQDQCSEYPQP